MPQALALAEIDAAVGFQRQKGPEVVATVAAPGLVQRVATVRKTASSEAKRKLPRVLAEGEKFGFLDLNLRPA
jgi:hypothetical protein